MLVFSDKIACINLQEYKFPHILRYGTLLLFVGYTSVLMSSRWDEPF